MKKDWNKDMHSSIQCQLHHYGSKAKLKKALLSGELERSRNFGVRKYNLVCQFLGLFKKQRYEVINSICQMCGDRLVPTRNEFPDDGCWQYGWVCSCDEKTRGIITKIERVNGS